MTSIIGPWAQAPDLIEPIVGYRAWRYTANERGVQLFAIGSFPDDPSATNDWDGAGSSWVTASCVFADEPTHVTPDEDCSCGFYATKSPDDVGVFASVIFQQAAMSLETQREAQREAQREEGVVFGRVQLAGKVIEHETGYRAERARIAELIPTTTDTGVTLAVASRLELPVGSTWDTTALLREMEEELRPSPTDRAERLRLLVRWRLMRHQRHFSLIRGDGSGDDPEVPPPVPLFPRGGSSPTVA